MYVSRDKSTAVVFAFSVNSDHWSNLVPRLMLQGLIPDAEYEVCEPLPDNVIQNTGNLMIIESEGLYIYTLIIAAKFLVYDLKNIYLHKIIAPVYQLGYPSVVFTGDILMNAGLPSK